MGSRFVETLVVFAITVAATAVPAGCGDSGAEEIEYCVNVECGLDEHGGFCGGCDWGQVCFASRCCEPDCEGKECSDDKDDGCGGTCGDCYVICTEDLKCEPCEPACAADGIPYECGDDGCGEGCGHCPDGEQWSCVDHLCICTPKCEDKECGDDLCGGTCGGCDEGMACSLEGTCIEKCTEEPDWSDVALAVHQWSFGFGGLPGEALDIDDNLDSCAPAGDCQDGLDNSFGGILRQIEQYIDVYNGLQEYLQFNDNRPVVELINPDLAGTPFSLNLYYGVPVKPNTVCNWEGPGCEFFIRRFSFDPSLCFPLTHFDDAIIKDGHLSARSSDGQFEIPILPHGKVVARIRARKLKLECNIVVVDGTVSGLTDCLLGAAFPKQDFIAKIFEIDDDTELPVSRELLAGMMNMFLISDIDLDGDGEMESVSYCLKFNAIEAKIAGFNPPQ